MSHRLNLLAVIQNAYCYSYPPHDSLSSRKHILFSLSILIHWVIYICYISARYSEVQMCVCVYTVVTHLFVLVYIPGGIGEAVRRKSIALRTVSKNRLHHQRPPT